MSETDLVPFQLLEINVISAQDLAPVTRSMHTYAVAWVDPERKLSTCVDTHGHVDPTWNDKFVFRVDDEFLHSDTSAVMIKIFALRPFRDVHVGTVRVLVGNLFPLSSLRSHQRSGMRFVALQVRRPSGRPQGILNIGAALLDKSMRSMPLYSQPNSSALGYRHLMGEDIRSPYRHYLSRQKFQHSLSSISREKIIKPINDDMSEKAVSVVKVPDLVIAIPPKVRVSDESVYSESDVCPTPSVREASIAAADYFPAPETENYAPEHWNDDDSSVEGLSSKLERWRAELPPTFHRGGYGSLKPRSSRHARRHSDGDVGEEEEELSGFGSFEPPSSNSKHARRHTDGGEVLGGFGFGSFESPSKNSEDSRRHSDGGGGLLSCFGGTYGCQCSIFCGASRLKKKMNREKVPLSSPSHCNVSR